MKKQLLMTPIGIVLGITFISAAILISGGFTGAKGFISLASFITVFGGLTAALIAHFSLKQFIIAWQVLRRSFIEEGIDDGEELIDTFVRLSSKARREGILSLEEDTDNMDDPFLRKGILLAVDGIEPDQIREILGTEITAAEEKNRKGCRVIEKAGEWAPAWGMVGTLVGLILMLQSLDDPSSLGPKMAIALITTFYGILLANLVFLPLAGKLNNLIEEETFFKHVKMEGIIGIQSGQNPQIMREKLSAFLLISEENIPDVRNSREDFLFGEEDRNVL